MCMFKCLRICGCAPRHTTWGAAETGHMAECAEFARARAAGYRAVQFNFVVSANTRAITTWERAGFVRVGTLPRAFDHPRANGPVDAYVMYREL